MRLDINRTADILRKKDNILIFCHRDPDGDTIGSAMALCDALSNMGKKVRMTCVSEVPENLRFMIREYPYFKEEFIVAVDVSTEKLLGDGDIRKTPVDLCIDHHASNNFYAKDTCLYDFPAAGELVFDIINAMGEKITPYAATCLLTAVSSDTGSFKYSGVTSKTLRCGASLLDLGADKDLVRIKLFESTKKARKMVEAKALSNMEYFKDDKIAVVSISLKMLEECNAAEDMLEGIASIPKTIEGVEIGITMTERDDGYIRCSVRTGESADACKICEVFQGGGHIRASGCRIKATMQEAKEKLLNEAFKQVK